VNVQAVASSHVLLVDGLAFGTALRRHGAMAGPVLSVVAKQLLTVLRDMEICAQPSSLQKVVCFLLQHRPARATEFEFELVGNKKDIAAQMGMAHETLSRVFGLLGKKNLIDIDQRRIRVKDATGLALFNPDGCE
jgi:CRP-like cAMP-binding protein